MTREDDGLHTFARYVHVLNARVYVYLYLAWRGLYFLLQLAIDNVQMHASLAMVESKLY